MQEDLSELAHELRKETCPQRVIDEALRKIAAETPRPSWLRYAIPAALAGAVLLCGLVVRSRLTGWNAGRQPEVAQQQASGRMQVARQTETALGIIGTVLLHAGAHSETVISDRAIPPLRNGLETAKNKIVRHTEL
jgi:anti-sigma factor RsiW